MGMSPLNLSNVRAKLEAAQGKRYWRTLDEVAESAAFEELLHREFPERATEWLDQFSRRNFLRLMGASIWM